MAEPKLLDQVSEQIKATFRACICNCRLAYPSLPVTIFAKPHKVYPNSPADKAGIVPNDIISHINEIQIRDFKFGEIKSILMQEGQIVTFSIKSKGQTKQTTIKLSEIL